MCSSLEAKYQNPKILCKTEQSLSAIVVLLLRITFLQPAWAQQPELVCGSEIFGISCAIDFLGETSHLSSLYFTFLIYSKVINGTDLLC